MRNKRFGDGLQYYIKGLLAEVTYGNKATYRYTNIINPLPSHSPSDSLMNANSLEGLEEQLTPTTAKFVDKDGKETTVFNYFNVKYQHDV